MKEIQARDEASKQRQQETIAKAERSIDQFYEEYAAKKERSIRENKCVVVRVSYTVYIVDTGDMKRARRAILE